MNSPRTRIAVSVQPVALIRVNFRPNSREFERVLNAATRGCLPLKARPPAVRTPAPARAPWPLSGPTCRSLRDLMPGGVSDHRPANQSTGVAIERTAARAEMFVGEVKSDGSWSESDNWYRARRRQPFGRNRSSAHLRHRPGTGGERQKAVVDPTGRVRQAQPLQKPVTNVSIADISNCRRLFLRRLSPATPWRPSGRACRSPR